MFLLYKLISIKIRFMKILLLPFIILPFFLSLNAQVTNSPVIPNQECILTLKDAPSLRGLKLGMSPDEVSKFLGAKVELKDKETSIFVKPRKQDKSPLDELAELGIPP